MGPSGSGQVDADALPRRTRHADVGAGVPRRHRARTAVGPRADGVAPRAGRVRVPVVQPDADAHRVGEHHAAVRAGRSQGRRGVARSRHRHRRPRRSAPPSTVGAVGRTAAAGRDRPGAGDAPRPRVRRRADRQPRLDDRCRGARVPARRRARHGPDRRDGHARPGGRRLRRRRSCSSPTGATVGSMEQPTPERVLDALKTIGS